MVKDFYKSREWENFRKVIINERGNVCQRCNKTIVEKGDLIIHHTPVELTEFNYMDATISLNPDNVQIVCASCHNLIHNKFGTAGKRDRSVYVVFGSACSGKTTYVQENADRNALILDVDKLYQALSINGVYDHSERLSENVMQVRSCILDMIRTKKGKWSDAYIITTDCSPVNLGRFRREYGAKFIHIDTSKDECIKRAYKRNTPQSVDYINKYFDLYNRYEELIKEVTSS